MKRALSRLVYHIVRGLVRLFYPKVTVEGAENLPEGAAMDTLPLNPDFDMAALHEQARVLNPNLKIFEVCARTGEGVDELAQWFRDGRDEMLAARYR